MRFNPANQKGRPMSNEIERNPDYVKSCKEKMLRLMTKGASYPPFSPFWSSARWIGRSPEAGIEFISMRDHFQHCLEYNVQWNPEDLREMLDYWAVVNERKED
jgi:hypothetical protein